MLPLLAAPLLRAAAPWACHVADPRRALHSLCQAAADWPDNERAPAGFRPMHGDPAGPAEPLPGTGISGANPLAVRALRRLWARQVEVPDTAGDAHDGWRGLAVASVAFDLRHVLATLLALLDCIPCGQAAAPPLAAGPAVYALLCDLSAWPVADARVFYHIVMWANRAQVIFNATAGSIGPARTEVGYVCGAGRTPLAAVLHLDALAPDATINMRLAASRALSDDVLVADFYQMAAVLLLAAATAPPDMAQAASPGGAWALLCHLTRAALGARDVTALPVPPPRGEPAPSPIWQQGTDEEFARARPPARLTPALAAAWSQARARPPAGAGPATPLGLSARRLLRRGVGNVARALHGAAALLDNGCLVRTCGVAGSDLVLFDLPIPLPEDTTHGDMAIVSRLLACLVLDH